MSDDSEPAFRQAVEDGTIIRLKTERTDEENQRLMTQMLATRCRGELLRHAVVDEQVEESETNERQRDG